MNPACSARLCLNGADVLFTNVTYTVHVTLVDHFNEDINIMNNNFKGIHGNPSK